MERVHPLRRWRLRNGVTLEKLASRKGVGVSPSHLSEIERGLNSPSLDLAASLSRATGGEVRMDDFAKSGVAA